MRATDRSGPVPDFRQGKQQSNVYGLAKGVVNQRASFHLGDLGRWPSSTSQVVQGSGTPRNEGLEPRHTGRNETGIRAEMKKRRLFSCQGGGSFSSSAANSHCCNRSRRLKSTSKDQKKKDPWVVAMHRRKSHLNLKCCLHFHVSTQARQRATKDRIQVLLQWNSPHDVRTSSADLSPAALNRRCRWRVQGSHSARAPKPFGPRDQVQTNFMTSNRAQRPHTFFPSLRVFSLRLCLL